MLLGGHKLDSSCIPPLKAVAVTPPLLVALELLRESTKFTLLAVRHHPTAQAGLHGGVGVAAPHPSKTSSPPDKGELQPQLSLGSPGGLSGLASLRWCQPETKSQLAPIFSEGEDFWEPVGFLEPLSAICWARDFGGLGLWLQRKHPGGNTDWQGEAKGC